MSLFYGNIFSFYKMPSHKRSTDAVGVFFFLHSKYQPKTRKPFVHTFSYISKRTIQKIIFYIHRICSSQTCPLAWWSILEMVGSRHTGIISLLQRFAADCLCVVLHLGYVSVVQYSKNCEYPATLSL